LRFFCLPPSSLGILDETGHDFPRLLLVFGAFLGRFLRFYIKREYSSSSYKFMGLGFWKLVVGAGCISGFLMRFSFFAFLAFFFLEKAGSTPFFLFSLLSISTKFWSLRHRHEKLFF
jgi:hypothetical protein